MNRDRSSIHGSPPRIGSSPLFADQVARSMKYRAFSVGPFAAQGILHRGAGLVDEVTDDEVTREAVMLAYHLSDRPTHGDVLTIAHPWRPFRMWATVLLHVWLRREQGGPTRSRAQAVPRPAAERG